MLRCEGVLKQRKIYVMEYIAKNVLTPLIENYRPIFASYTFYRKTSWFICTWCKWLFTFNTKYKQPLWEKVVDDIKSKLNNLQSYIILHNEIYWNLTPSYGEYEKSRFIKSKYEDILAIEAVQWIMVYNPFFRSYSLMRNEKRCVWEIWLLLQCEALWW